MSRPERITIIPIVLRMVLLRSTADYEDNRAADDSAEEQFHIASPHK